MTVTAAEVRRLASRLRGPVVLRGDAEYAASAGSRFPNLEVPWEPQVVVRPGTFTDVMAATTFAAEHHLGVAVRGGGVGWAGARPGTLLLDLRDLDRVSVDPERERVSVQGGAIWRDVAAALAPFGLAAAGPQFPRLGVAGHVLGGGHGWLTSKLGWASDTLSSVDVVTADGRLVHASADHEPDLFWALRGAGHNFGVAVGLELDLIPLETVHFGIVWFEPDRTAEALAFARDQVTAASDDLTAIISVAHRDGRAAAHALVCHCGDATELDELRGHPAVVADTIRAMPWAELATGNDVFAANVHRRSRMHYVHRFDDAVIDVIARRAREHDPLTFVSTHYYGGALARVAEHATAMSHRDQHWNVMVATTWPAGGSGAALRAWQDDYLAELEPHAADAYYVNYLFDEPGHVASAYHPATWRRLRALKRQWDPDNRFADNQNVPPSEPEGADPDAAQALGERVEHGALRP